MTSSQSVEKRWPSCTPHRGSEPTNGQQRLRVERFHRAHHALAAAEVALPETRLFLNGHSCSSIGPARSPDPLRRRPDVILGNCGDAEGERVPGDVDLTFSPILLRKVASMFRDRLRSAAVGAGDGPPIFGTVSLNVPFAGGHGVQSHARWPDGVPGLQVELNQGLWANEESLECSEHRVVLIRGVLGAWIEDVVSLLPG